jgi:hypothetical protein
MSDCKSVTAFICIHSIYESTNPSYLLINHHLDCHHLTTPVNQGMSYLNSSLSLWVQISGQICLSFHRTRQLQGSYTRGSKEIVDIEIANYQTAGTIVTTAMELLLLKPTISEEEQVGDFRN